METVMDVLNNYVGRDSIIRTCSYFSLLLSEYVDESLSRKLRTVSSELSYCRLINRLFDDLPMLRFSLQYGLGSKESDKLLRMLWVFQNITDQLYLPIEHMAWAADKNILNVKSNLFHVITTGLWALSSYLSILRCLVTIARLESNKEGIENMMDRKAAKQQFEELLYAFKSSADFIIAVNYLPSGSFMWAGTLSRKKVALYGLISSILRVFLFVRNIKMI